MKKLLTIWTVCLIWSTQSFGLEPILIEAGDNVYEHLQEALIEVEPGQTIQLGMGRFELADSLSLDVENVTVQGMGMFRTTLSFKGQQAGSEGLLVTSDNVTLQNFAVEDTKGDGIKVKGVDGIKMINLRVEWTRGPHQDNGAYGLYPVESTNVLVDGSIVMGCSDAGIYVGQSKHIVVRNSRVEDNVAGIEIENSYYADVYDNVAVHNTAGILVFDLPNIPQQGGHDIRVFRNRSERNDTPNFAKPGNTVANVPVGIGLLVMANHNVEVFDNDFRDNQTTNIAITTYSQKFDDANYYPYPEGVHIHHNRLGRAGWNPDMKQSADMVAAAGGKTLPSIVWDGIVNEKYANQEIPPEKRIYIHDNEGEVSFLNAALAATAGQDKGRDLSAHAGQPPMTIKPVKLSMK
ncbi:MAG: parallel beta-helix domain-containing protein [Pseudomonadota bacterium]